MHELKAENQPFAVSLAESSSTPGAYTISFRPKGGREGGASLPPAQESYVVEVRGDDGNLIFEWRNPPAEPDLQRFELEAQSRLVKRKRWISCVSKLADRIEEWANELGWSSRRIDKSLDDAWIGTHRVPALLLQEDLVRVLLDPVSPWAPGAEGIVDLYLMPGYDDVANLYFLDNEWRLNYVFPRPGAIAKVKEGQSVGLSKETFSAVLEAMKQHGR